MATESKSDKKNWADVAIEIINLLKVIFESERVTIVGKMNFYLCILFGIIIIGALWLGKITENSLLYILIVIFAFFYLFIESVKMGSNSLAAGKLAQMKRKLKQLERERKRIAEDVLID